MYVSAFLRFALVVGLMSSAAFPATADDKPKSTGEKKPVVEQKSPAPKPATAKSADSKPGEAKPAAAKPRKPTRVKPGDDDVKLAAPKPPKPLTPGGKYVAGDMQRPRPPVIAPPTPSDQQQPGRAPSDAIVLFDGTNFDRWTSDGKRDAKGKPIEVAPKWLIKNGYMECVPRGGGISTKDAFGDCQLHIEWATPSTVVGSSQGRGNSGVMLHSIGEVQVLDSYDNDTYPDGQAAAIYSKYPPQVNASRKPGEWQTYDIVLELARVDEKTKQLVRPARISVVHNGVVVHHATELDTRVQSFRFGLQDHGNPIRFRNIWLRPLPGYDSAAKEVAAAEKPDAKPAEAKQPEPKKAEPAADAKKPVAKKPEPKK